MGLVLNLVGFVVFGGYGYLYGFGDYDYDYVYDYGDGYLYIYEVDVSMVEEGCVGYWDLVLFINEQFFVLIFEFLGGNI